jgi:hypothetical protein
VNNARNSNPTELVDRYLQAVRFWLPRTERPQDLIAELGEDLRSQIEEKERELGRPVDEAEVSAILKRCGAPMIVASRLGPKRFLIGPTLFPIYEFVLKLVLLWILVPVLVFIVGPVNVVNSAGDWRTAVLSTIGDLWSGLFISAGVITLVFAILERTHAEFRMAEKWDPQTLPPLAKPERKKSVAQTIAELIFGSIGLIWLLLIPHYPVLILGPAAAFLKAAPLWHTFYVPILLLGVVGLVRAGMTLARPQWTWFPPAGALVQAVLTLILVRFLLNASGQMTNGEWHPFVVLADAAKNSVQYIRVAAIVNVSILVSLVCAWFGICIAMIVHVWQLLRLIRKRVSNAGQPASLHA